MLFGFLDACSYLYMRVYPSVRPYVRGSVCLLALYIKQKPPKDAPACLIDNVYRPNHTFSD